MEAKLEKIFDNVLKTDSVVEVFADFVNLSQEEHEKRIKMALYHFRELLRELPSEDTYVKGCISTLVSFFHKQKHVRHVDFMADVIRVCIKESILPPKPALECLLGSDLLKPTGRLHWCKTFEITKEFIHLNDYKGCRDILRLIFNKIKPIPVKSWVNSQDQMNSVVNLVEYILDPEACLLPGYLAVNEVRLYVGEDQLLGHWNLSNRVAEFVDRFRAIASMVLTTGRSDLLPIFNHFSPPQTSPWKLDPETLRFAAVMKILLPYDRSFYESQTKLLRYVLAQPYSRDMVFHVLGIQKYQKQKCKPLESELVELIIGAMEQSDDDENYNENDGLYPMSQLHWQHLASQMIYFIIFGFAVFPKMVETLHQKLVTRNVTKGRDHLLWVLLQYVSGSIQKNPLSDFLPTVKLIHLLYPEKVPLPEPDSTKLFSMHQFSAICIIMHLNKKIQQELQKHEASNSAGGSTSSSTGYQYCQIPIPLSLQGHYEFVQSCLDQKNITLDSYSSSIVCNACSTASDIFNGFLNQIVNSIEGDASETIPMPGENCVAFSKTIPLSMNLLDSLTVHTKMSIIQHIVYKVLDLAQSQNNPNNIALSPAFVETYSRLLVYMETETPGVKGLLSHVFPKVLQNNSLGTLNMLLEMCSYRLHHIHPQHRIQLLTSLHKLALNPNTNHNQLQVCIESTALRMIMALLNADVKPQLSRYTTDNDPKQIIVSKDSEEFNRVLVLTLARSIRITGAISGAWCTDILKAIMEETPHTWGSHTLNCFPRNLQDFYMNAAVKVTDKETLKNNVEEEYRKWGKVIGHDPNAPIEKSMEQEAMNYFTMENPQPIFLCLLFKVLSSGHNLAPVCYSIVTALGRRRLSSHVRMFSDFLVYEFSRDGGSHVKRYIPIVLDMILKYDLVFFDQLILCLALRCNEIDEAQVAYFIIQYLLLKPEDFRGRILYFTQETKSADHWTMNDWHTKHMMYHNKYPEKFFFEGLKESVGDLDGDLKLHEKSEQYLPVYFGNLPLRFLPVFDIVIHRSIELMQMSDTVMPAESLLTHVGPLYKFHAQPITYLFNTLHYYEGRLRDHHKLKKLLVATIIGSLNDVKPANWALSEQFLEYLHHQTLKWEPGNDFYCHLVKRVVFTMLDKRPAPFPPHDWRFNEFPNSSAHALHITCIELMALPVHPDAVGLALMDVVLKMQSIIDRKEIMSWINAVALILTTLPDVYWEPLHAQLINIMMSPALTSSPKEMTSYPYHLMKFSDQHLSFSDQPCTRLLALAHAVWHHMGIRHLSLVPQFLKEQVKPIVTAELQLLYVCHLIAPFLPRFQQERTRCMLDVVIVLYDMLQQVSKTSEGIRFMDEIADFLYHIKYIHVGDAIRDQVEKIIEGLQPALRKRLRFIYSTSAKPQFQSPNSTSVSGS